MTQSDYEIYLLQQLNGFLAELNHKTQELNEDHPFALWLQRTSAVAKAGPADYGTLRQQVLALFTHYTDMAPLFPRDILYFLGGECLHFMPDEEITAYQALDEMRFEAESQQKRFDWEQSKQSLKNLQ
jgi:hypothetical protein